MLVYLYNIFFKKNIFKKNISKCGKNEKTIMFQKINMK